MHTVIRKTLLALNLATLCALPALAGQTPFPIPSMSSLSRIDNAAYRSYIAKGIADVPCVKVDSEELAQAMVQVRADLKSGVRDFATCPDGSLTLVGYKPTHLAAASPKPRENTAGPTPANSADAYQLISDFNDVLLDGKVLAAKNAKIQISGYYKKNGDAERLYASLVDAYQDSDKFIPVVTDNAQRSLREHLLTQCTGVMPGCQIAVGGHMQMCHYLSAMRANYPPIPCLNVEVEIQ